MGRGLELDSRLGGATEQMNLMSSTLVFDESGEPLHIQQRKQIDAFRAAWKEAGHTREPRVSVSRSIFAIIDDRDRAYFGRSGDEHDSIGYLDANTRAVFGRSYAAEPEKLVAELKGDTAIEAADTLLLTVPNQLGVDYNAHAIESILSTSRPSWAGARPKSAPSRERGRCPPSPGLRRSAPEKRSGRRRV